MTPPGGQSLLTAVPQKRSLHRKHGDSASTRIDKISVVATTVLKQRLTGSQTYKACTKGSGKIKLKGGKKHHG
jgi:hypothetical protein